MIEPFDDEMYNDEIVVYALVRDADSESDENLIDGPAVGPAMACCLFDPTLAPMLMPGVEPGARDLVTIYCPSNPGVSGGNQLVAQTKGARQTIDPPRQLRSTEEQRPPSNILPCWVVTAQWLTG